MTNVIRPEADAPVDHMKIHKDVVWVIRTLWSGALVIIVAALWVAALAADVENNSEEIEEKADTATVAALAATLERIEGKIDEGDTRQRQIQQSVARLEQKVEDLEDEIDAE